MAITVNVDQVEQVGNSKLAYGSVTFDSSYPTGGEAFAISSPQAIERIAHVQGGGGGYVIQWDKANQKALVYMGDNNNASDGPLIEVANTTDLSSVTMSFVAVGQ